MTRSEMFKKAGELGYRIHSRDDANFFLLKDFNVDGVVQTIGFQTYSRYDDYPDEMFEHPYPGGCHTVNYVKTENIPQIN